MNIFKKLKAKKTQPLKNSRGFLAKKLNASGFLRLCQTNLVCRNFLRLHFLLCYKVNSNLIVIISLQKSKYFSKNQGFKNSSRFFPKNSRILKKNSRIFQKKTQGFSRKLNALEATSLSRPPKNRSINKPALRVGDQDREVTMRNGKE